MSGPRAGAPAASGAGRELETYELAIINNGPRLAVRAALANLLDSGRLRRTGRGFIATGQGAGTHPLETEILTAAGERPRLPFALLWRISRGPWIRATVARLTEAGDLLPRASRRLILFRNVVPALVLLAAAGLSYSYGDDTSALLLLMVGLFLTVVLSRNSQTGVRASKAGVRLLGAYRDAEPSRTGGWAPGHSVALYGMRQLERDDPDLAAQVGIPLNDGPLGDGPLGDGPLGDGPLGDGPLGDADPLSPP